MGLKKLEVTLLLILLQFLLLLPDQDAYPSTSAAAATYITDIIQGPNATGSKITGDKLTDSKKVVIGGSRGGGGIAFGGSGAGEAAGGHAFGGSGAGEAGEGSAIGGRGAGGEDEAAGVRHPNSLIPMFVPDHHGQNNQHYRNSSSQGNGSTIDLPNLLLVLLLVVYLFDMFA